MVTTASGVLTGADARQAKSYLLGYPRFRSGLCELADFRAVTKMDLSSEDIERLIAMDESYADVLDSYDVAFLVASDVAFGMARMYQMRRKREGPRLRLPGRSRCAGVAGLSV